MRALLVYIFSLTTILMGKTLLIETANGNLEPGINGSDYKSERKCFPKDWRYSACPPLHGVMIIEDDPYDVTTKKNYRECWTHCRDLYADDRNIGCLAWTFDKSTSKCSTFNSHPHCYQADNHQEHWISGQSCN